MTLSDPNSGFRVDDARLPSNRIHAYLKCMREIVAALAVAACKMAGVVLGFAGPPGCYQLWIWEYLHTRAYRRGSLSLRNLSALHIRAG